jgi:hypothetical protein
MRTTTTTRYIDVTEEAKVRLTRVFGCTPTMVYLALTYRKDTELARKIRHTALRDHGGKPMCHCPECETLHNVTEDNRHLMVQNFDNGARLEIDKQTGAAVVYNRNGAVIGRRQIVKFPELAELQLFAESL